MKNRQFITLLLIIILWFIFLNYKIDKLQRTATNIDENVATVDERIVRKIQPWIEDIQDKMYDIENSINSLDF